MPIPLGTKFLTYKGAPKSSGYEVTKILPDKNYWCANIIHKNVAMNMLELYFLKMF
jgi:hypothetical protein